MGRNDAPPRLPEPIPASYYARRGHAQPEATGYAVAFTALHDRIAVAWARRFGGRDARLPVLAGSTVAGGLVAAAALVLLLNHAPPSSNAGLTSSRSSPPVQDASPPAASGPVSAALPPVATPAPTHRASPAPSGTPSAAPASVTLLNAPLASRRGRSVSLQARTTPGATCSIVLGYASAPDLGPAVADAGGGVSWTWRVAGQAPAGTWPITVTCGGATATTRIVVG